VALVTGAGQGIGRGTALALAKEGAAVAVAGRTLSKCEAVAAEIAELGARAVPVACDVGVREEVEAAVAATVRAFGALDILVNNAQSSVQARLEDTTEADIELAWRTGAMATFYAMQAAFPHLRASGRGSIVNFGSSAAIEGNVAFGAYAMAKEAIRGLSRVASREWGPYGIRVNVIVPNALSPSSEEFRDAHPDRFARMEARVPLRRVGDPESDIGRAVVALAADDLTYLSGQTLMLTGGA
jgi:NAD(P)-dependent dehydrogenase (short-subunit alcohol dehydrogenase family)